MAKFGQALRLLIFTSLRIAPGASLACLAETAGVLLTLLQTWALAAFVGAAVHEDRQGMILSAAFFVGQIALSRILTIIGMNARFNQLERVGEEFAARTASMIANIPTVDHLDDPKYQDQLHILQERRGEIGLALNTLLNQLNTLIGVVGVLTLAASADPKMVLVALAGIPAVLVGPIVARWQGRAEDASAQPGRLARRLVALSIDPGNAGEIRTFRLKSGLHSRLRSASRAWQKPMVDLAMREAALIAGTQILFFGVAAAVVGWLVNDTLAGTVGVSELTLALLLVTRLQRVTTDMRGIISKVADMTRTASRYLWLIDLSESLSSRNSASSEAPLNGGSLVLNNVNYRYPGSSRDALRAVSVSIQAGTTVAIVGNNGAGKSTLSEVIAGLRPPTGGTVTFGGVDLPSVPPQRWYEVVSGAFQDYVRFEFDLQSAVGVGDLPRRADRTAVLNATRLGGAERLVSSLPNGLATQLGARWPGGVDLSGGEWQRVAISRGMMRSHPRVRILDEPTSALDPITEHELFSHYADIAKSDRDNAGTVTILVTHRFSTVTSAELILVLDDGEIVEMGSHEELMSVDGKYSRLYRLQARGYAMNISPKVGKS